MREQKSLSQFVHSKADATTDGERTDRRTKPLLLSNSFIFYKEEKIFQIDLQRGPKIGPLIIKSIKKVNEQKAK